MSDVPDTLWFSEPFASFGGPERLDLLDHSEVRSVAAGGTIYEPGDLSAGAYVLLEGRAEMSDPLMATIGGKPVQVERPGTIVSKASLLEPFEHRHRFSAVTDCSFLLIPRDAFQARFADGAVFALRLLDHVVVSGSAEVRELNGAIHSLLSGS